MLMLEAFGRRINTSRKSKMTAGIVPGKWQVTALIADDVSSSRWPAGGSSGRRMMNTARGGDKDVDVEAFGRRINTSRKSKMTAGIVPAFMETMMLVDGANLEKEGRPKLMLTANADLFYTEFKMAQKKNNNLQFGATHFTPPGGEDCEGEDCEKVQEEVDKTGKDDAGAVWAEKKETTTDSWELFEKKLQDNPNWRDEEEIRSIFERWSAHYNKRYASEAQKKRKYAVFEKKMRHFDYYHSLNIFNVSNSNRIIDDIVDIKLSLDVHCDLTAREFVTKANGTRGVVLKKSGPDPYYDKDDDGYQWNWDLDFFWRLGRSDLEIKSIFETLIMLFGKVYAGAEEKETRFAIFKSKVRFIEEKELTLRKSSSRLWLDYFYDMTPREYFAIKHHPSTHSSSDGNLTTTSLRNAGDSTDQINICGEKMKDSGAAVSEESLKEKQFYCLRDFPAWRSKELHSMFEEYNGYRGKCYASKREREREFKIFKEKVRFIEEMTARNLGYRLKLSLLATMDFKNYFRHLNQTFKKH